MSEHAQRAHAILSASGSSRWMACPPSALLEEKFPDKDTEFFKEGTLTHEIAECMLRTIPFLRPKGDGWMKWHEKHVAIGQTMDDKTFNEFRNYLHHYTGMVEAKMIAARIKDKGAVLVVEKRLDLSPWIPESFGHVDALIIADGTQEVIDLKYGRGVPVSAVNNSQMRLYGLGAVAAYSGLYEIEQVRMTISQPRITDQVSMEILSVEELLKWGEEVVKPAAAIAWEGKGEFKSGSHCRFCKAGAQCRTRAEENLTLAQEEFKAPTLLTDEEIGNILEKAQDLQSWVTTVKDWVFAQMKDHRKEIPGWKLVEGRANRKITDPDKAASLLLESGYAEDEVFEKKMLGITALEKNIGKKPFTEILGSLIEKPPGAPTLAPESDPRIPWRSPEAEFGDSPEIQSSLLD